jgi:hypothetical protein
MTTLKQAEHALANREPFTAGNLSARISGGVYEVFSYFTLIGASTPYSPSDFAEVMPSAYEHSVTTSKHANIVKRAWGITA